MKAENQNRSSKFIARFFAAFLVLTFLFTTSFSEISNAQTYGTGSSNSGKKRPGGKKGSKTGAAIIIGIGIAAAIAASQAKKKKKKKARVKSRKKYTKKKRVVKKKRVARRKPSRKIRRTPRPVPVRVPDLPEFVSDEILITFAQGVSEDLITAFAAEFGLELLERARIELIGQTVVRFRSINKGSMKSLRATLRNDPRVAGPHLNMLYDLTGNAGPQYALKKLKVERAHAHARGEGVLVAVIDSGINASHPALADVVLDQFVAIKNDDQNMGGHGTAVASIIAARGDLSSIAPGARLLSVKAFAKRKGAGQRHGQARATSFDLLKGIDWAVEKGAEILNMSFAGPRDELLRDVILKTADMGIISVAAAGNRGRRAPPAYPAAYESVIAATATDIKNHLYPQANRGKYIDIAAPGVDILVASKAKGYELISGTSMAAAYISGAVALMIEKSQGGNPVKITRHLMEAAIDLGTRGRDITYGFGLVDPMAALNSLPANAPAQDIAAQAAPAAQ